MEQPCDKNDFRENVLTFELIKHIQYCLKLITVICTQKYYCKLNGLMHFYVRITDKMMYKIKLSQIIRSR